MRGGRSRDGECGRKSDCGMNAKPRRSMPARTMRTTKKFDEGIFVKTRLMEEVVGEELG